MADDEKKDGEGEGEAEAKKGGGIVKMAIMGIVLMVVIVGSNVGTLIMAKSMMPDLIYPEWMMALQPIPEDEEELVDLTAPPVYTRMNPQIVVSYQDGSSVRFLQVTLEAMARDEESILAFELHIPRIRNDLLIAFASENLDYLSTTEGKEAMRATALTKVQEILSDEDPTAKIEQVYFTSFVVQ